jgi:hypothetical protein
MVAWLEVASWARRAGESSMVVIIDAIAALAAKSKTMGARLWRGLREPRIARAPHNLRPRRVPSRARANFVIFR